MEENLVYKSLNDDESARYLKKYFVTKFRPGYVKCKECVLPEYFIQFGDKIRKLEIRDDDIWVCTFPKSGTTWTQEMVWCIANDLDFKGAEEFILKRFPFLELPSLFDLREIIAINPELNLPNFVSNPVDYLSKLPSPRFIKTHLPFNLLPEKLQNNSTKAKIINVVRNPRDTCVSYYYHFKVAGYTGSFEIFCHLFLQGYLCFAPFWNHVSQYWERRNNSNLLIIHYEEMKKDLKSTVYNVANFIGKTLSEGEVKKLLDHLSFSNMKKNQAVNYESAMEINKKYGLTTGDWNIMRQGQIDDYKKIMTEEIIEKFRQWEEENSKHIGFS